MNNCCKQKPLTPSYIMKGKYIIALCGEDHTGKTETIQNLILRLGLERVPRKWKDWIAHGTYKDITISAHCGGDSIKKVINEVMEITKNDVQIIITAIHPKEQNIIDLKTQFPDYEIIEVGKYKLGDIDKNSGAVGLQLLCRLFRAVG